ncbi:hypothetical protein LCGC14_1067770 [marine sediment metagenome]|uniref:Uncharacterized protein n=1 Tax=marine sediment metagenome TaxID=412755 RepID=A0A0F9QQ24_9ZZZZ
MKNKTKKILYSILDFLGYGMGISLSVNTTNILYKVFKNGQATVVHTWFIPSLRKSSLLAEIGLTAGSTVFFIYKFIKNMIDREKLLK